MPGSIETSIVRGLLCRCPQCGVTGIYEGVLKVRAECEACGLDMRNEDSGDGPAVFLIFGISLITAIVLLFMVFRLGLHMWLSVITMVILVTILTIVTLRPSKSLLIALAWHHKSGDQSAR